MQGSVNLNGRNFTVGKNNVKFYLINNKSCAIEVVTGWGKGWKSHKIMMHSGRGCALRLLSPQHLAILF